jgi:hypothetical protein
MWDNEKKDGGNPMSNQPPESSETTLSETENNAIFRDEDIDGNTIYLLILNNVTIHFYQEEWDEFLELIKPLNKPGLKK